MQLLLFGASSLERHFTIDRTAYGTDQAASLTPMGLRTLIGGIRNIELAIDNSITEKEILDIEKPVAKKLRSHIK